MIEENKRVWNRIGFKGMIPRLIESGAFCAPNKTPMQSVWEMNCIEGLQFLSLKNAGG